MSPTAARSRAARHQRAHGEIEVLTRPLVVVTGKGGVGKTTVATALGLLAARHGLRTLLVEVAGRNDIPPLLDGAPSPAFAEQRLAEGLDHISVDPEHAVEEYLREQLPSRALGALLAHNRSFGLLAAAAPGLSEMVTIGKVWRMANQGRRADRHDLVILDGPATGQAVALLAAPTTFAALTRHGPINHQARDITQFLSDPERTSVVVVSTAEELPVSETLDLRERLRSGPGLDFDAVVSNAMVPNRFTSSDLRTLRSAKASSAGGVALSDASHARHQRNQLRRLRRAVAPMSVLRLPFVFSAMSPEALADLSRILERNL